VLSDDPASVPLTGPAWGIESFCVEGTVDGTHAHAEWDGRWVVASSALLVRAELAMAVDDVFAETHGAPDVRLRDEALRDRPERLLRAMLVVCDAIGAAEFTHHGRRRVIAR
jgi:3-deoxy-D-manno-octulosonic acid (KDO) 8-phosphate synthase